MDTKKLRQKILDLAIRGKLVPQDPNDEPASVLLERIRAEKEQLIKEGKIKRSKKSAATDKSHYENVPFEIPENWCWVTGNDIFNAMISCKPQGDEFKYIDIDSIDNKNHRIISPKILKVKNAPSRASRYTQPGDVLFSMVRPYLKNIALVEEGSCIASTGFFVCSPMQLLTSEYCYYMMLSDYVIYGLNQYMKGDNSPSINNGHITSWLYPIPPINEQLRISAEIKKWFVFIDDLERGKIELESLIKQVKSTILDLAISGKLLPQDPNDEPAIELLKRINPDFQSCDNSHYGNLPFEVPDGWYWAKINDVTEFIKNGAQIKQFKGASGIPITRIETISNSELDMARMGYANITNGAEYKDYYIKDGDILMSHINSRAHIGKCALCNVGENQIIHGMNLLRIRCGKQILPEYMVHYFRSTTFYNLIEPHIKNAVNQASINITNLQKILIPIPPYSEQKRVALMVDKLFSTIDTITAEL